MNSILDLFTIDNPLVTFLVSGFALFILYSLVRYIMLYIWSREWLAVEATVKNYQFEKGSLNKGTIDSLDIDYIYHVNGQEYKSNKLEITQHAFPYWMFSPRVELARKFYEAVESKTKISVFYDKSNPSLSCLDRSLDIRAICCSLLIVAGLIIIFIIPIL